MNNKSLPDLIVEKIISDIHSGKLKPGDCLPGERSLAKKYGWGRGSIIEAIKRLQQEKYVERFPGRGTFIVENIHQTMSLVRLLFVSPTPVISREILNPENFSIYMTVFQGMVLYAGQHNTQVVFQCFPETDDASELERQYEKALEYDGAIFIGSNDLSRLRRKLTGNHFNVGCVAGFSAKPSEFEHRVLSSHKLGVQKIANYLKSREYKKIAIVVGQAGFSLSENEEYKVRVLRDELSDYMRVEDKHIYNMPKSTDYNDLQFTISREFCEDYELIICFNTHVIPQIYQQLLTQRLLPGEDIDLIAMCSEHMVENMVPSMTYIKTPLFTIGEKLCQSVVDEARGHKAGKAYIKLEPELVIGQSSRK